MPILKSCTTSLYARRNSSRVSVYNGTLTTLDMIVYEAGIGKTGARIRDLLYLASSLWSRQPRCQDSTPLPTQMQTDADC